MNYNDFCLYDGSNIRGFTLEGAAFELRNLYCQTVFNDRPSISTRNSRIFGWVGIGCQRQCGTWIDSLGFVFDMEVEFPKIPSILGGFVLDPVKHLAKLGGL